MNQPLLFFVALGCLGLMGGSSHASAATLFPTNSVWKYRPGTNEVTATDPASWRLTSFDDSAWSSGATPIYYGESYAGGTLLSGMQNRYTTLFLRRTFVVTNLSEIGGLRLGAFCDDGYIAWINGTEVQRYNVPTNAFLPYNGTAVGSVLEPIAYFTRDLTNATRSLVEGANVLAVQVFNVSLDSSDLVINLSLESAMVDTNAPLISAVNPASGSVTSLSTLAVTFSEPVKGVKTTSLLLNNRPATAMSAASDGRSYTFQFPQPSFGTVSFSWSDLDEIVDFAIPANRFDPAGPGATWSYQLLDRVAPEVISINPPGGTLLRRLGQIEVLFNEAVTGLRAGDLRLNSLGATNLVQLSSSNYVFQFVPVTSGGAQVAWSNSHAIVDAATPPNPFAGGSWSYQVDPAAPTPEVRLNELVAYNQSGLLDEDGEAQDWVEFYNRGTNTLNLGGWSLSDDAKLPGQWILPAVALGPNQYLVVFLSGKDRSSTLAGARLHANFKLSAGGGYLALYNAESPREILSRFNPYPEQRMDFSYGSDALGQLKYFAVPTPGGPNGKSDVAGVVAMPALSVDHGFFNAPFTLHLSCETPGATIRYTTNGSVPTATAGLDYTGPILIKGLTTLRAAAFKSNSLPSLVVTRTYLFPGDVRRQTGAGFPSAWGSAAADYAIDTAVTEHAQYKATFEGDLQSLPSLSIVMDANELFGPGGIYSNPLGEGVAWERAGSAEYFEPNGKGFTLDCGVRIQGGYGRRPEIIKHSFRLVFKGVYGAGKLAYPLFEGSPVEEFDTLILRAGFNNSWIWSTTEARQATYLQDEFIRNSYREMGQVSGRGNFVHLYLNGLYWGVYNTTERPSAGFAASYLGGDKDEWDALNSSEPIDGNKDAWNTLQTLANAGVASDDKYKAIQQYVDVDNLIDYMLVNFYGGNVDWDDHNWYAARRRAPGETYKFFCWDAERTLEGVGGNDRTGINQADKPSRLYAMLRLNAEFRLLFADHAHRHLFNNGVLTPGQAATRYTLLTNELYRGIVGESARWGNLRRSPAYMRHVEWQTEVDRLYASYFPQRHSVLLNQLRAASLYPSVVAPTFSQHGGRVQRGFSLTLSAPAGTLYYTIDGTDPRVYLSGAVAASATIYTINPLVLQGSTTVKSRVLNGTTWSALNAATFHVETIDSPLRLVEIMYNPPGGDAYEFIELQNTGTAEIEVGGMFFEGITYVFPAGKKIGGGARLVLASSLNPASFASRYPGVNVAGRFGGALSNGGDRLVLRDAAGRQLWVLNYNDKAGWPTTADGGGYSLEVVDPAGNPDAPSNWRASVVRLGSPGSVPPTIAPGPVLFSEVMAENLSAVTNATSHPDWIELKNISSNPVNLQNWSLTDDGTVKKFVLPSVTLPPGGFLVVWCDSLTNLPGLHTGFALAREGENLSLYDPAGQRMDAITYGLQLPDLSVALLEGGWNLALPTPGATNQAAPLAAPAGLRINEWMANPLPGGEDWLEIFNTNKTAAASLQGIYLATSNAVFQLADLSFVPPGGYVRLWADEIPMAGHIGFKLSAAGSALELYDRAAKAIHRLTYTTQAPGISEGLLPDGNGLKTRFPSSASPEAANYLPVFGGVRLNEVMARAGVGVGVDWVELYNPTITNITLSDYSLSLDPNGTGRWLFPAGTLLGPDQYLVLEWDETRAPSTVSGRRMNVGRNLDGQGGAIYLHNPAGQRLDLVEYGFQVSGRTLGRIGNQWQLLQRPTPEGANSVAATLGAVQQLRFNEWMASPEAGEDDWFELYNEGVLPAPLGGLFLSDDPSLGNRTNTVIAPLSFVGGYSHVKFVADGNTNAGANHAGFVLSGQGEALRLYHTNLVVLDGIDYGLQLRGISMGRYPDGGATLMSFAHSATPGQTNSPGQPPLVVGHPQSRVYQAGQRVGLQVQVIGSQPLSLQWERNGVPLPGATNESLLFPAMTAAQAGKYSVRATNWFGFALSLEAWVETDSDGDGLPDRWESDHGLDPQSAADAALDADGDGNSNLAEFLSGTDPKDAASVLWVDLGAGTGGGYSLRFLAAPLRGYTLLYRDAMEEGMWQKWGDVAPAGVAREVQLLETAPNVKRFYRLVTPIQPE